jgi:hypothetical protein
MPLIKLVQCSRTPFSLRVYLCPPTSQELIISLRLNVRKPLLHLAPESVQRQDSNAGRYLSNQLNSRNSNEVRSRPPNSKSRLVECFPQVRIGDVRIRMNDISSHQSATWSSDAYPFGTPSSHVRLHSINRQKTTHALAAEFSAQARRESLVRPSLR